MISFNLIPENFIPLEVECKILPITFLNLYENINLIKDTIKYFNDEIIWDKMFNINEAIERISNGMVMYVLILDYDVLGHVWFTNNNNGRELFNLFVRNKIVLKPYLGKQFVSDVIKRFEYGKNIYCEVDDWNEKSIKLFKRLGFKLV